MHTWEKGFVGECGLCQYAPHVADGNWGYLRGPEWVDTCRHVHEQRRCPSCDEDWWQEGLDDSWDIDGCARAICPECAAEGVTLEQCRPATPAREDGEEWRGREREEFDREQQARIQAWR